jgi:Ca2+-binding EF-hand superfamily protein
MKIAIPLSCLLLACATDGTALAQASRTELKPVAFSTLDKNKDGKISLVEAKADPGLYEAFAMLDVNHDGSLTPAEFAAWPRAVKTGVTRDPATAPGGSAGAQHMPPPRE